MPKQMFVATMSGSAEVNGETRVFVRGHTIVAEGDKLLAQLPAEYFKPAEESVHDTAVLVHHADETATAHVPAAKRGGQKAD